MLRLLVAAGLTVWGLAAAESRTPVIVELFTSEGCSSCPPADRLLTELSKQVVQGAQVIVLAEHVDYWDHLGWRDPYSSPLFTSRQQAYGELFRIESVYTPQMVVDGIANFNGADGEQAQKMIHLAAQQPKAVVEVEKKEEGRVTVKVDRLSAAHTDKADVFLAVTESGLTSSVAAGENTGHLLRHTGVVRSLVKLVEIDARRGAYTADLKVQVQRGWQRDNTRAVVFVQDRKTRRIIGAATCRL